MQRAQDLGFDRSRLEVLQAVYFARGGRTIAEPVLRRAFEEGLEPRAEVARDSIVLIFIIMVIVTRALVAAGVIVGTIVMSLGAAFGFSTLIWQHLLNFQLHWVATEFALIVLLAVGSDYNLMLVSRIEEEIGAGLKTDSSAAWVLPARW